MHMVLIELSTRHVVLVDDDVNVRISFWFKKKYHSSVSGFWENFTNSLSNHQLTRKENNPYVGRCLVC